MWGQPPWSQSHSLARDPSDSLVSPLRNVRLQEAFRHPLYSLVCMQLVPPLSSGIKIEYTVLHWTMPPFANVVNLNACA
jgi:hypothetical protein